MDIHFISTLTPEDEERYAPMVIGAVKAILDLMPISYTLRIETASARVFTHAKTDDVEDTSADVVRVRPSPFGAGRLRAS